MPAVGTYIQHPTLVDPLPPLVRKQRRLAKAIAVVAQAVKDEKAVRQDIDVLLLAAGLKKSELVTCAGYDVRHHEKAGQESLNADTITASLIAAGVAPELVAQVLMDSTETGQLSVYCTVTPTKGAQVRAPQARPGSLRLMGREHAVAADRKRA